MKAFGIGVVLLSLAMSVIACRVSIQVAPQPAELTGVSTAIPTTVAPTATPAPTRGATPIGTDNSPDPTRQVKPPQSQAALIQSQELRSTLTHLSNLIGFRVLDDHGDELGVAVDYIVNTCETYIIYILMEPAARLNADPGSRVVIPFEAVTINSGLLDAQARTIRLRLLPEQLSGAPALPAGHPLTPTDWESAVRAFWSKAVRIGKLATSCNVVGGPVYKVAHAAQLLGVKLYDGNHNLLGAVQEAILEPESGKVNFYIVKPSEGEGLVMVHLRAVNIPKEALQPGAALSLELLADPQVFCDSPRITGVDEAGDYVLQGKMNQYWDR